jgi:hypothetical protein
VVFLLIARSATCFRAARDAKVDFFFTSAISDSKPAATARRAPGVREIVGAE